MGEVIDFPKKRADYYFLLCQIDAGAVKHLRKKGLLSMHGRPAYWWRDDEGAIVLWPRRRKK